STLKSLRGTEKIKKSFVGNTPVIFRNRKQLKRKGKNGGAGRNRTGVHGVAVRCITTLPPRRGSLDSGFCSQEALRDLEKLERETRFELATPTLARLCSTN